MFSLIGGKEILKKSFYFQSLNEFLKEKLYSRKYRPIFSNLNMESMVKQGAAEGNLHALAWQRSSYIEVITPLS